MAVILPITPEYDLAAKAPGRPLRIVLMAFYNYQAHAIRIFQPLLKQRGHDVHTIYFKNFFTFHEPTQTDCDLVVDLVAQLNPDLVAMSVWSTYYQLAARLTRRIKAQANPVVIWGGIHAQTKPQQCLESVDIVCKGEGEIVLADLTDRMSLDRPFADLPGCWVRDGDEVRDNPPRMLLPSLDALPPIDLSPENKYYLSYNQWRDVETWDRDAVSFDMMTSRGCPFECSFCIHNFTRTAFSELGTYLRRRSVDHTMAELHAAKAAFPKLNAIAFSDDIFSPPRPWLEEFCERYGKEIGLPFIMYSYPGMVDEKKVALMRSAGLWFTTIGVQSGSERMRRDLYERETSNETILRAAKTFADFGVGRNLDFIADNPYETDEDRRETLDLLMRLPKPFYFNHYTLTYFPGVDMTERARRDGIITEEDIEDVAQKGYHLWGVDLINSRPPKSLYWDVLYAMAVHGFPRWLIEYLMDAPFFLRHIRVFTRVMRRIRVFSRWKTRMVDRLVGRPNLLYQYWRDVNRDDTPADVVIQPNFDNSPFSVPLKPSAERQHAALQ